MEWLRHALVVSKHAKQHKYASSYQSLLPQLRKQALNGVGVVLLHAMASWLDMLGVSGVTPLLQGCGNPRLLLRCRDGIRHFNIPGLNPFIHLSYRTVTVLY